MSPLTLDGKKIIISVKDENNKIKKIECDNLHKALLYVRSK